MRGEGGGEKGEREIRTFWDDIREEALREGLQQGLQQGLLISAQEMVLEALEERFGRVEEEIRRVIEAIESRELLKRIHRLPFRASSLEEILEKIKRHSS